MQDVKKPKLKRDWVGRYVRLKMQIETRNGNIFTPGMVMQVQRNYGGLELEYIEACDRCRLQHRHRINDVPESDVELLPESFKS